MRMIGIWKTKGRVLTLAAVAAGITLSGGFAGCESTPRSTNDEGATTAEPAAQVKETAPPEPATRYTTAWPGIQAKDLSWSNMAFPTGSAATSAVGVEKGVPQQVRLNSPFEYVIRVTNLADLQLSNVIVTDQLGPNFEFISSNPKPISTTNGNYTWAFDSMAPKVTKLITVTGRATAEQMIASCAKVTYDSALCSSIDVVQPKLKIVKSAPAEVLKCDPFTYTLEVSNPGTGTVRGVTVNDPLPNGIATTDGKRTVNIKVGDLASGQTKRYRVSVEASSTGSFVNKATASGVDNTKATSNEVTTVVRAPKLAISKTGPKELFIGAQATYQIEVKNTGDGIARAAKLIDSVPAGAVFVSASDNGKLQSGRVNWDLGDLVPNATRRVSVTFRPAKPGTIRNVATVEAFCADKVSAEVETRFSGIPAILLEVIDIDDPIKVGDQTTYVITATNQGSAPGTNIKIVCNLEANMQLVSTDGITTGRGSDGTITFAPLATLEAGKRAVWRVTVRALKSGDVRFKVQMTSDQLTRPVDETEATTLYDF